MQPRTRQRDSSPPGDADLVIDAAAALGVREFDLFRLAYRRWYGREADDKRLERYFAPYMFHQIAPPWVRHMCREVRARAAEGRLDPDDFEAGTVRRVQRPVPLGWLYVTLTLAAALVAHILILWSYNNGPAPGPEDVGPGLRFFFGLFGGRAG